MTAPAADPSTQPALQVAFASVSSQGGRSYNEDSWGRAQAEEHLVFVVADGAGGHGGGDIASRLTVDYVIAQATAAPVHRGDEVEDLLRDTNSRILFEQKTMGGAAQNMHTTVVALFVDLARQVALWGHAGDSRLYLFRDGRLLQHTRDHSVVQNMVDGGLIPAAAARRHGLRSQLLSALGVPADDLMVDANAPPWLIQHGDAFLICSDGMWEYVEDEDIVTSLGAASDPQAWLDDLSLRVQAAALAAGNSNHDNYTALGLWVTAPALTQGR